MQDEDRVSTFSGQVLALFGTQVFAAGVGIFNGILLARLLGPAAKGDYYLIVMLPATATVLVQLGLPQAFGFFAARGRTIGIVGKSVVLTGILATVALGGLLVLGPLLRDSLLAGMGLTQVLVAFIALPFALNATLCTAIVIGRKAVRWYSAINVAYSVATTLLLVVILGGISSSVSGALAVYLFSTAIQSIGFAIAARRVVALDIPLGSASYRELLAYGLPYFPASLTGFFSYRADVYLIALLIPNASAPLGYYSMAVGLAELVFFFPNAVSVLFFPHVAGAPREEADRQVAFVSRVTLLVTSVFAVLMIPVAVTVIWVLLPAFIPSIAPFLMLLPGVVALSAAKVIGQYITGIGRPGIASYVSVAALAVNIITNLILIPPFGVVGAAAASLVSYSFSAFSQTAIAAHFAGTSAAGFWIIRTSDIRFAIGTGVGLLRRLRSAALDQA